MARIMVAAWPRDCNTCPLKDLELDFNFRQPRKCSDCMSSLWSSKEETYKKLMPKVTKKIRERLIGKDIEDH